MPYIALFLEKICKIFGAMEAASLYPRAVTCTYR